MDGKELWKRKVQIGLSQEKKEEVGEFFNVSN